MIDTITPNVLLIDGQWRAASGGSTYDVINPATEETIKELAAAGVKRIAVITPGFVSDCIETLEEIDIAARETFLHAGGDAFDLIPCINDSAKTTALLKTLIRREAAGWIA